MDLVNIMGCRSNCLYTPWVQERYRPDFDTCVCRICNDYKVRPHVEGTEMFPKWLGILIESEYGIERIE